MSRLLVDPILGNPLSLDCFPSGRLSIAVVGPGTGESVIVRLPDGSWGVVDGAHRHSDADRPNPVHALLEQARSRSSPFCLRFVAMTHPHEDHILGLAELIDTFEPQHLWWAGVEHPRVFEDLCTQLVAGTDKRPSGDSPANTLQNLIKAMTKRAANKGCLPAWLGNNTELLRLRGVCGHDVVVRGVLPTTTSTHRALSQLKFGRPESPPDREPDELTPDLESQDPADLEVNEVSGAIVVEWGQARIVLGGDALKGPTQGKEAHKRGWAWWLRHHEDPDRRAQIVKMAHHASSGAHQPTLWQRWQPDLAIVTPFKRASGQSPPRPQILAARLEDTGAVALTAAPEWKAASPLLWRSSAPASPPRLSPKPGFKSTGGPVYRSEADAVSATLDQKGAILEWRLHGQAAQLLPAP